MDLSSLDTRAGSALGAFLHLKFDRQALYVTDENGDQVLDDKGKPKPIGLRIRGIDDPHFARLRAKKEQEAQRRLLKGDKYSPEEEREANIDLVARAIMEPVNLVLEGKPVGSTHEDLVALLDRFPWIYDQVNTGVGERARFVGNFSAS